MATVADAAVIATQRARMFQDTGEVPDELFEPLRAQTQDYLQETLAAGLYVAWLASAQEQPELIIAGAGVHLRRVMPHIRRDAAGESKVAEGRHGIVLNVFTEPAWRRHGIASLLMKEIVGWARTQDLDRLVLHASDEGRALYQRFGFVETNEMRLAAG